MQRPLRPLGAEGAGKGSGCGPLFRFAPGHKAMGPRARQDHVAVKALFMSKKLTSGDCRNLT